MAIILDTVQCIQFFKNNILETASVSIIRYKGGNDPSLYHWTLKEVRSLLNPNIINISIFLFSSPDGSPRGKAAGALS
jgi:hypothetical protein